MMLPVVVVQVLEEFLLTYNFARVMEQIFKDVVLGGREVYKDTATMDRLLERIQFDIKGFQGGVGCALSSPDEDLGTSNEFPEIEGLGKVVVSTGVEQLDYRVLAF